MSGQTPPIDDVWVRTPHDNDVLCGRGGSINSHPGNERFRKLVEKRKKLYVTARFKTEKRLIAHSIVSDIHGLKPPGRFLSQDAKTGMWKDIGEEKARDKTSQALRENAPEIRHQITEQRAAAASENKKGSTDISLAATASTSSSSSGSSAVSPNTAQPPQHPPPPGAYGHNPWGPYPPPGPYSAYSHHPHPGHYPPHHQPPPPPPPQPIAHPSSLIPPPPPPYYGPPSHWGSGHYYPPAPHPHHCAPPQPVQPKSSIQQTVEMVASSAESIKSWTKMSFVGNNSKKPKPKESSSSQMNSVMYVHGDNKRRSVKFTEACKFSTDNSMTDGHVDMEPEQVSSLAKRDTNLLSNVASHILSSIGSWDTSTIVCGHDTADDRRLEYPTAPTEDEGDEEMEVEWEGQEVQLIEENLKSHKKSMPPPAPNQRRYMAGDQTMSSMGMSSLGSCRSWLHETAGDSVASKGCLSASGHSIGMMSIGDANMSLGGSIGGASLTRVFDNESVREVDEDEPSVSNLRIHEMPSWERNLRGTSAFGNRESEMCQ